MSVKKALSLLERVKRSGEERIIVGLSGGKDSLVTLDLCVRVFGEAGVQPFHLYLLPGLECEQGPIRRIVSRYKSLPPVIELPHPKLRVFLADSVARPLTPSLKRRLGVNFYNWAVVERIVRSRTGIRWIAYGHRMIDSPQRRGMLNRCQGWWEYNYKGDKPVRKVFPIYDWRPSDIFSYIRNRRLPTPDMMVFKHNKSCGTNLADPRLYQWLQQHYPQDYLRIKRLFPDSDVYRVRDEIRARLGIDNQSLLPPE